MKFATRNDKRDRSPANEASSAFTLAEVLAALMFMAIVIPVALEGMHVAALAGAVAQRKGEAARVAQRILALTAAIWHNDNIGATTRRSLIAYDH